MWGIRTLAAAAVALTLVLVAGPAVIAWLAARSREPNHSDSAHLRLLHAAKDKTPTMGGLLVIGAILVAVALCGDLGDAGLQATIFLALGLTALGLMDDLLKVRSAGGFSARTKLAGQVLVAVAAAGWFYVRSAAGTGFLLYLPWTDEPLVLGTWFVPLAVLVIVGSSNAVNLTDGLDGLAAGCLTAAMAALGLVAYVGAADAELADGSRCGAIAVLAGALVGGLLGFLYYNRHPARVFMGDAGSLPLGGLLGLAAVVLGQEILLVMIGGVFVAETASVILQVGSYKLRRKRIFLCAPLHHHFQFLGWSETRVVRGFWLAAACCAVAGAAWTLAV